MSLLRFLLFLALVTGTHAADDAIATGLNRGIEFLETKLKNDPEDFTAANQLVDRLLRRLRWLGRLEDLRRADEVSTQSLKAITPELNPSGLAERIRVLSALHRFGEGADLARQLETLMPGKSLPPQLLGDALLELGDLDAAEHALAEALSRGQRSFTTQFSATRLAWQRGDLDGTGKHLDAVVELSGEESAEVRTWALIQRGEYAFRRGRHDDAERDYLAALALAPKHWNAQEHLAELRGCQGRYEEAATLFHEAATATNRPELWQALGDLHLFNRKPEAAKLAHDTARSAYRASLTRREVLYVHHLAAFFSDSEQDATRAVELAEQDLKLRKTAAAYDSLAWALYRRGDFSAAVATSEKALAGGIRDSHILYHAGTIRLSAGEVAEGQRLLRRAAETNPHFAGFHMHH